MEQIVRFKNEASANQFAIALNERVNNYFKERNISKHANFEMIFKTVFGIILWIGSYMLIMTDWFVTPLAVIGMYVFHGFAQLFMAFNIAHDANHGAYSKNEKVNRALCYVFDVVGINSYMWRLMHNDSHHSFVNIQGTDVAIKSNYIFRFSPDEKRLAHHRFQHLYAPFVYCLATFEWVLLKDYNWFFFKKDIGNKKRIRHPRKEVLILLFTKAFYYTYTLVLPIIFLSTAWYNIVLGFIIMHFFIGFTIALIFQTTHVVEGTVYPAPDEDGYVHNDYIRHIIDTTSDYAWRSPVVNWFLGCLNVHAIHHIYPKICHVHYPALTKIIKATAEEYGLTYREKRTIAGAFLSHLKLLKILGQYDHPVSLST